jgi:hypothetical protein
MGSDETISITQTGKQINGSLYDGTQTVLFTANLIKDNQIAVGKMYYTSTPDFFYFFQMRINPQNPAQFQGSLLYPGTSQPFSFCATRVVGGDEVLPIPCNWP